MANQDKGLFFSENEILINKANALAESGEYNKAIEYYDKALEIDPNYLDAWNNKGLVLTILKIYGEAIKCYDKALEIDPKKAVTWYIIHLGFVRSKGLFHLKTLSFVISVYLSRICSLPLKK